MPNSLPLRIFLASPSDTATERQVVRACVDEFNARAGDESAVTFEVVGWDRVRGTARRPQSAINELIDECHYMVVLFKGAWGSEPGSPWGYTSGTEEELFTGLLELGRREQPMRDVWIGFLTSASPAAEIVALKNQMSLGHSMMYELVDAGRDLKDKLSLRLGAWAESAEHKVPRHVDLLPSSGKDVLRAANLRMRGEKLVELGQGDAGALDLKEASILGGPDEFLAYARFLGRRGDLDAAFPETQKAIEFFSGDSTLLDSPAAAEAFAAQASLMRRQGRDGDAIGRFEQAISLLHHTDPYSEKVRCRILDELGLAQKKVGNVVGARANFTSALELRRERGLEQDISQSLVNLARLEVGEGDLQSADQYVQEVLTSLAGSPPTALHANAEVLAAQVLLRQGTLAEALAHASRALALNQQIASRTGEAIALLLITQCHRASRNFAEAAIAAKACIDLNTSMGDHAGVARAQWQLDEIAAEVSAGEPHEG